MEETIQQSVNNMAFTLDNIAVSSHQLSDNEVLMSALEKEDFQPQVPPIINSFRNTSFAIYAVTLYTDTVTYTTYNIRGVEPLSTFQNDPDFTTFFTTSETSYLSVRTDNIADNYDYFNYDERYGMVTQVTKLMDGDTIKGYLFVDIKPEYLYTRFLQYENHDTMQGSASFLLDNNDQFLLSSSNTESMFQTAENQDFSSNVRSFVFTSTLNDQYQIVHVIPTTVVWNELLVVVFYMAIAFAIIFGVSIVVSKVIHHRIEEPLSMLQNKVLHEPNIPD
jgi:hypothetical protein